MKTGCPNCFSRLDSISSLVYNFEFEGTMPDWANHWYVGNVLKSWMLLLKKSTTFWPSL